MPQQDPLQPCTRTHVLTVTMRQLLTMSLVCASISCGAPQTPQPAPPEPDRRLESCRDALANEDSDLQNVVSACSVMWRNTACSRAWIESLEMPQVTGAEHIIERCKVAYCSQPDHAICLEKTAVDLMDPEVDWLWLWTDLNTVILREDLDKRVEAPEAGQFARLLLNRVIFNNTTREHR